MSSFKNTNMRIAIVGAGAAGLMAALQLRKLGYTNIRIFEKRNRIGGKCFTPTIEGRNYELGAVIVGRTTYSVINELLKDFDLECFPISKTRLMSNQSGGTPPIFPLIKDYLTRFRPAIHAYLSSLEGVPSFSQSGYLGFDPERFGMTFTEWAKKHNAADIVDVMAPIYTGFGYGYLNQVSAPQVFKIYDQNRFAKTFSFNPFRPAPMLSIKEGFQGLWSRVAELFDVALGTNIQKIERGETVQIHTETEVSSFDKLILACPLHGITPVMDLSEREHTLYQKIQTIDYQTITASVEGLGPKGLVFFIENMSDDRCGHLVCGYRRWKESNIWALYVIGDGKMTNDEIVSRIQSDLSDVGAQITKLHRHDKWDFYPHVSPEDFRDGFYPQLEALQGENHTYIVGEIVSSATVEAVARYSRDHINQYFSTS